MASFTPDPGDSKGRLCLINLSTAEQARFFAGTANISTFFARRTSVHFAIAEALKEVCGRSFCEDLAAQLRARFYGAFRMQIEPTFSNADNYSRMGIALAAICGSPYTPLGCGGLIATNELTHSENIPLGVRSPYRGDPFHTDGHGFDDFAEDFIILICATKYRVQGGESTLLHLDDWDEKENFLSLPWARVPVRYVYTRQGALRTEVFRSLTSYEGLDFRYRPIFSGSDEAPSITFTRGYMHPEKAEQELYVDSLSDALNRQSKFLEFPLERGGLYIVNNNVWLHGRKPITPDPKLYRRLFQLRGRF